jgi:hypothetical protein
MIRFEIHCRIENGAPAEGTQPEDDDKAERGSLVKEERQYCYSVTKKIVKTKDQ